MLKTSFLSSKTWRFPLLLLLVSLVSACTLLLDKSKDQCVSSADCASFGSDFQCVQGVCVAPGSGACTPKTPKTERLDFLNEKCTNATCIPFDNCATVGFCGGELPALVAPPKGGS